jgi:hypothetical protein
MAAVPISVRKLYRQYRINPSIKTIATINQWLVLNIPL